MEIRVLAEADARAWWELRIEALESEPFAFGKSVEEHRATSVETVAQRFREASPDYFTLGAFEHGSLVGAATYIRDRGRKEAHKGRVFGVYVSGMHRRKGIARALMCALLDRVRADSTVEQVLLAVSTRQIAARELYRSCGFETWGTEPAALRVGSTYIDEEHMILRLATRS